MLLMLRTNTHLNTTLGNFTRFNLLIDILIFIYQIFNIKTRDNRIISFLLRFYGKINPKCVFDVKLVVEISME